MISTIMFRKLRLRQKNGFLIKKRVYEKSERKVRGVAKIFTNTSDSLHATLSILDVCGGSGHACEANPLCLVSSNSTLHSIWLLLQNLLSILATLRENTYCCLWTFFSQEPAGINLFKVNNRNTRPRCEVCSKLIIKTPERHQWRRSSVFIVNFEHISHLVLVFVLLTLNM